MAPPRPLPAKRPWDIPASPFEMRDAGIAMAMVVLDIDERLLSGAAIVFGTRTKKDTVNAALKDAGNRPLRRRHLERLIQKADFRASPTRDHGRRMAVGRAGERPAPNRKGPDERGLSVILLG